MVATCLEPHKVAAALGIDRSVLDHWVLEGWLPTHDRRAGDDRIDLAAALRFIRHYHLTVRKPDAIGLNAAGIEPETLQAERRELARAVRDPDLDVLINLLIARYASHANFPEYLDRVLTPTARRRSSATGHADPASRCAEALRALVELIRPPEQHAPVAVAAALDGVVDPVPSAMAAVVLADRLHRAHDLGPGSLAPTIVRAAAEHHARIIYVFLGDAPVNTAILRDQLAYIARQVSDSQARLMAGGGAARQHPEILPPSTAVIPDQRALDALLTQHV